MSTLVGEEVATRRIKTPANATVPLEFMTAGEVYAYDGTNWTVIVPGDDLWFKVYVTRNDAAVTMPAGYDQKCKIGYVYNDSGSNFDPFVQFDRTFTPLLRNSVGTFTAVIQTLVDASVFLPPTRVRVNMFGCINDILGYIAVGAVPDGYGPVTFARDYGIMYSFALKAETTPFINFGPVMVEYQAVYASVDRGTGALDVASWEW